MSKTKQAIPLTEPTILVPADKYGPPKHINFQTLKDVLSEIWRMNMGDWQRMVLEMVSKNRFDEGSEPLRITAQELARMEESLPCPTDGSFGNEFRMQYRKPADMHDALRYNQSFQPTDLVRPYEMIWLRKEFLKTRSCSPSSKHPHGRQQFTDRIFWELITPVVIIGKPLPQ